MGFLSDLFGGGARDDARRQAREAEAAEQQRLARIERGRADINNIFGDTFTPSFFETIKQGYMDWAMPQLDRQNVDVKRNLSFALARAGTSRSSAGAQGKADLQTNYDLKRQDIARTGMNLADQRRADVENSRQAIESQLFATADPVAAAQSAQNTAVATSREPVYNPLGQALVDTSNWYGQARQQGVDPMQFMRSGGRSGRSSGMRVGG
jgi:hypothetical protein